MDGRMSNVSEARSVKFNSNQAVDGDMSLDFYIHVSDVE
jgi:hypothetical protein